MTKKNSSSVMGALNEWLHMNGRRTPACGRPTQRRMEITGERKHPKQKRERTGG